MSEAIKIVRWAYDIGAIVGKMEEEIYDREFHEKIQHVISRLEPLIDQSLHTKLQHIHTDLQIIINKKENKYFRVQTVLMKFEGYMDDAFIQAITRAGW